MHYSYREPTKLSRENALAVKSLGATGELPNDHYWNALRTRYDANPTRIERGNVVLAALLNRDQMQRQGFLTASAPLFPNSNFFSYAGAKHALNSIRFDHWHPFLGRLFDLKLPPVTAGQDLTPTTPDVPIIPVVPTTPVVITPPTIGTGTNPNNPVAQLPGPDSSGGNGPGSGGNGPGSGGTVIIVPPTPSAAVPEPSSAVMLGMALALGLAGMVFARMVRRGSSPAGQPTPA